MTPVEFFEMLEGYQDRLDNQKYLIAWHACLVRNPHLKKKDQSTPDQLLGKKKKNQNPFEVVQEIDKALVKLNERISKNGKRKNNSVSSR